MPKRKPPAEAGARRRCSQATGLGRKGGVEPFDLTIGSGEIVGLAGLLGSGRTETARLLFGADRADQGKLLIEGQEIGWTRRARRSTGASPSARRTARPRASSKI